jgi:hypothetical protein
MAALAVHPTSAGAAASSSGAPGYWLVASDAGVYQFGTTNFGSLRGHPLNQPVVGSAATPDGLGYWLAASDGGVFSFGDAKFHGSTGNIRLTQPIVGMATDPATGGYWLVARDGGVFSFGAPFFGSTGHIRLNQPVVGMAVTPDSRGYWLVAADGGVFSFGDAKFHGSTGKIRLNKPVVGMAGTGGGGYWLVASDGGIFTFDAPFYGSAGNVNLVQPIVGMAVNGNGAGYWLAARDGGIFTFGYAPYRGSTGAAPGPAPVVSIMATLHGFPFPPGQTGYDVSQGSCGNLPPSLSFAVVQVNAGYISSAGPNPCYVQEAQWAGANMSGYIFLDGLPSPAPRESLTGCNGNIDCQSYNYGRYWATRWIAYSHSQGINPSIWWLDVEVPGPGIYWSSDLTSNAYVVTGAVAAVRAMGAQVGVYSTSYQWPRIVGSLTFPGIPLWAAGADYVTGDQFSATSFCVSSAQRFAGGVMTLVQYGWVPGGQPSPYSDPDYACS